MDSENQSEFITAYRGSFTSMMRWHHLDDFWKTLNDQADDQWFIYAVGEEPPTQTKTKIELQSFIKELDTLLRTEHTEDYCGIVYADDKLSPQFIKIYDPNNLGVSCGFSDNPPLPGWVLSKLQPLELETALRPPNNRRRWWNRLFSQ
ncbi:MAG: hypothetical protein QM484_10765 [Woeseiaceae bacterium]